MLATSCLEESLNKMEKQKWLAELAGFIVEANGKTWAGEGREVPPERPGYKELEYSRGIWKLRDSYTGYFRAPGMTTVYFKGMPSWTMSYGGSGQLNGFENIAKPTFAFLKHSLMQVTPQMPFRGPKEVIGRNVHEGFTYEFSLVKGDITDFVGEERIRRDMDKVFEQIVFGGTVRHKNPERTVIEPWEL